MVFHINLIRYVRVFVGAEMVYKKSSILHYKFKYQTTVKGMGNEKIGNMQIKNHTVVWLLCLVSF